MPTILPKLHTRSSWPGKSACVSLAWMKTATWICALFAMALMAGCGAYAEAAKEDAGGFDGGCELIFEPNEHIKQGELKEFTIRFDSPPPWVGEDGTIAYLTQFVFDDGDTEIGYTRADYDGLETITAVITAGLQAKTGEHHLEVEVRRNRPDDGQQIHQASGLFYVMRAQGSDAGLNDGGS